MRLPLTIVIVMALAGCSVLGDVLDGGQGGGQGGSAGGAPGDSPAPAQAAQAAAGPDEAAPAAPNGNGETQIAAAPTATAPPAPPATTAPAVPAPPRPSAAACDEVTAAGPAREIDLDAVRTLLRGVDYRRATFESNATYRARVITRLDGVEALALARTGRPELVFSLPIPAYRSGYDADRQELGVGSDLGLLPGGSAIGMGDFILVKSNERQIGRHRSLIAYGARRGSGATGGAPGVEREVAKIAGDQLGVIVQGASSMGWPATFERLRIAMPPAEAQRVRPSLAVLFVARLQEPYFATGEFIQEAKLDDLVEKRLTVEAIRVTVDCAAVYDRRSGRVLRQIIPRI